jgi:hypothetical protein
MRSYKDRRGQAGSRLPGKARIPGNQRVARAQMMRTSKQSAKLTSDSVAEWRNHQRN